MHRATKLQVLITNSSVGSDTARASPTCPGTPRAPHLVVVLLEVLKDFPGPHVQRHGARHAGALHLEHLPLDRRLGRTLHQRPQACSILMKSVGLDTILDTPRRSTRSVSSQTSRRCLPLWQLCRSSRLSAGYCTRRQTADHVSLLLKQLTSIIRHTHASKATGSFTFTIPGTVETKRNSVA